MEQGHIWKRTALAGLAVAGLAVVVLGMGGCGRFRPGPAEQYVYVTAKQAVLVDRAAAVSNRTGTVNNGDRLVVLERGRRVLKVRAPHGEVGWIKEMQTAGPEVAGQFEAMGKEHGKDPVVATATALNEVYLHAAPGLKTARFYLLNEGDKLNLLERATVEKQGAAAVLPAKTVAKSAAAAGAVSDAVAMPAPAMEDWWLVRDAKGQTGWIYSRLIDVAAPDTLARYAEGQRTVGAYVLGYSDDAESGVLDSGSVVTRIPEYVEVLSPYKAGLPYDFDQVRVFTWNPKKHRYETAFRQKNIAGYLPVTMGTLADPYSKAANAQEKLPSFTFRVLSAEAPVPVPDPVTGLVRPGKTIAKTYRLEGNTVRRIVAPGPAPEEAHPEPVAEKKGKAKVGGKKRK